jgi:cytochrome c551/c552
MNHRLLTFTIALLAFGVSGSAAAQTTLAVDATLAKRGKGLWEKKGCMICHRIGGGRAAGPDLQHIFEQRSMDWLTRFLKNTSEMLANDSLAMELLAQNKKMKMPDMQLTDADVDAVLHYMAQEIAKLADD